MCRPLSIPSPRDVFLAKTFSLASGVLKGLLHLSLISSFLSSSFEESFEEYSLFWELMTDLFSSFPASPKRFGHKAKGWGVSQM
jgi:hypothetical protein